MRVGSKPHTASAARPRGGAPPQEAPLHHPAVVGAVVVAALAVLASVTHLISDPDLFQHLTVGKVIWQTHAVPVRHLWTWPSYGTSEVLPSWLFRALLWPFYDRGGVLGLFAWRWLTTLAAFGFLWAAARRMGARGLATLVVLVVGSLVYRQRSQVRPETLVVALLALQIWVLECRRRGGPKREAWLIGIALVWANAHISYYLGLVVLAAFWLDAWWTARGRGRALDADPREATRLGWIVLGAAVVSLVNPFGWRALWQPFEYFLYWRHEPIFQIIGELRPIEWSANWKNGLPLLLAGWPALLLWRSIRKGPDVAEIVLFACFTGLVFFGQRFLGFYAVVAAPYVARGLGEWISTRSWMPGLPLATRAGIAAAACIGVGLGEWSDSKWPLGTQLDQNKYPVGACDFMAAQGVRGRGFNQFELAGYLLFRFWPERDRLPFIDIHQTASHEDRALYALLHVDPAAWRRLHQRWRFDYALLDRMSLRDNHLLDFLDADSTWALVFADDVAALYLRRDGPLAAVANRDAYRLMPGGTARIAELQRRSGADSIYRARLVAELERAAAGSSAQVQTYSLLANVALTAGDHAEARAYLTRMLEMDPRAFRAHERLGLISLAEGRPAEALREFREERRHNRSTPGLDLRMGQAYRSLGDLRRARQGYERELRHDPGNQEVRDSLAALGGGR